MKKFTDKITVRGAITAVLCGAMLLTGAIMPTAPVSAAEINDSTIAGLEEQINALQQQQNALLGQINSIKNEVYVAYDYKIQMDALVTVTAQKMELADALVKELEGKISDSEKEITKKEKEIADTKEKVIERLRYAQENGNVSELELILEAKGMSDFLSRLDKVNSMIEYDRDIMTNYKSQKTDLESKQTTLEASKSAQETTIAALEKEKEEYAAMAQESLDYMTQLQNNQAQLEAQFNKASAAEDALNAELTEYIKKLQAQNQVVPDQTGFMRPIKQGVGYVSSPYGWRTIYGVSDFHQGTDIACGHGTPILASSGGKVIIAESHWSYGNYLIIDHGGGISTLYAHCSSLAVSVGQTVTKGQTIAYVGSTGFSTGNHVHFEYRINGERQDPEQYVTLR